MIRSTTQDVSAIIETDSTIDLAPFVRIASRLVDQIESNDVESKLATEDLKEIETLLAAHFYSFRDQQYSSRKTADASATFQGKTGMGLDSSLYGQGAKILDVTGFLDNLGKGVREAGVLWGGTEYSQANGNIHESERAFRWF